MSMPIEERVGSYLKRAELALAARKDAVLRPLGLTVAQYAALYTLEQHPGMSSAGLARASLVTPQTMATTVANLERKGLVMRRPHPLHLNVTETELTRQGRELLLSADNAASAAEQQLASHFSAEERAALIAMLLRCEEQLRSALELSARSGDGEAARPAR